MKARLLLLSVMAGLHPAAVTSLSGAEACSARSLRCCEVDLAPSARRAAPLGLGLQVWPEDVTREPDDLLAMRPAAIRYSGGPSWQRTPRLGSMASFGEALAYVRAQFEGDRAKYEQQARSFSDWTRRAGAKAHFVVWEPPATDAEPNDIDPARDKRRFDEAGTVGTANFYAALFKVLGEFGYPIDAVEISNEPDGDWNLHLPPQTYSRLLEALRLSARRNDVSLPKIAGPGTSSIAALNEYLRDERVARAMLANLDLVSVHAWDDRSNKDLLAEAVRAKGRLKLLGHAEAVAVTEFGLTFLQPDDRASGRGAMTRSPAAVSGRQDYAARSISAALSLGSFGFGPIIYWEYRDPSWGKASYGLRDVAGRPRPTQAPWAALSALSRDTVGLKAERLLDGSAFVMSGQRGAEGAIFVNRGPGSLDIVFGGDPVSRRIGGLGRAGSPASALCQGVTGEPGLRLAPGEVRIVN
jgi:hypothetical protein